MKQRKKARSLFLPRSCISTLTGSHGIAKHRERYGAAAPESLVAAKATTYNTTAGAKVPRRWLPTARCVAQKRRVCRGGLRSFALGAYGHEHC